MKLSADINELNATLQQHIDEVDDIEQKMLNVSKKRRVRKVERVKRLHDELHEANMADVDKDQY